MGLCQNKLNKTGVDDPAPLANNPKAKSESPDPKKQITAEQSKIQESDVINAKKTGQPQPEDAVSFSPNLGSSQLGKSNLKNSIGKDKN